MDSIRESIKDHLKISSELHVTANKLLEEVDEPGFLKKIRAVAREKGLSLSLLRNKVTILQEKQAYYDSKPRIEEIINDVFNKGLSKTHAIKTYVDKISKTLLENEYDKRDKLGSSYQYEECVTHGGVFTYLEEASLLDHLNIWKNTLQCECQVCSLVNIMISAYVLAKRENKDYPSEWDNQEKADLKWIFEYEMRHYDDISNFKGPDSCQLESQAPTNTLLYSLDKQQISKPSTSRGYLQGNIEISKPSTSRGHLQGDIEQEQDPNVHIRESIKKHIQLSETLSNAASEILYNKKDIIAIALLYDLDVWILQRKVEITKRTNDYLAKLFEQATQNYALVEFEKQSPDQYVSTYVNKRIIEPEFTNHLIAECQRFYNILWSGNPTYDYKKITISYEIFTSSEEEKILEQLYQWKGANAQQCHCIICAMEHLLSLAYQFAKERNIQHPPEWDVCEKVDELWLLEFQMRNSEEICKFDPFCTKELRASTSARPPPSSLQQETSDLSPLHALQLKRSKPSQKSNIHIMRTSEEESEDLGGWVRRHLDIRGRIRRHLEISDQLDKAAKEVLEENKDIGSVARNHKLDIWILNQKVLILKLRKEQLDDLSRSQLAVNSVRCNIISVSDSAERYNVDKAFIENKLSELEDSENIMYIQLTLRNDNNVFKFNEEFLLLKRLRSLKSEEVQFLRIYCYCRTCALEYLPSLAYQFASEKNIPTPSPWKEFKKADEIWIYKFQMRHSIEIAKYFSHTCKAGEGLIVSAASALLSNK